ncbi:alkaline phosphatase D family protein [Microlunatus parietis]|uniref:Alkaline phosphatase D n=1 Tax=Microlunatus parietis TaxID=682979 RepID=A0A7Y9I6T0_9ACTN|nr:alkaline phosphatase D family protein [Microlunatus parietis]NYE71332.1 alkaline phosphatase D [Microlunatus parietis]
MSATELNSPLPTHPQPNPTASRLSRRGLLGLGGVTVVAASSVAWTSTAAAKPLQADPFTLGVASGEPAADGVVLWTRLAIQPTALDGLGGMPSRPVEVEWEVALDPGFRRIAQRGRIDAKPERAHSVHVELRGLRPSSEYWYRFRAERYVSMIGRTKTAPAPGHQNKEMTFAFVSCQNLPAGYFNAYEHLAAEQLDLVAHLGDYIYEGVGASQLPGRSHLPAAEIFSLADYRVRHAQYKTDPYLQAAHASAPWVAVPDDHEVENNYAGAISQIDTEPDQDPAVFLARRAAAYQAYWEHLPFRRSSMPKGPDMQLYRRLPYGTLIDFDLIDTRQYRADQVEPCPGDCPARWDPTRTILGDRQEDWLIGALSKTRATWKIIGNQSVTFDADGTTGEGVSYSTDNWMGYAGARQRLYERIADRGVKNFVVITGDAHRSAAANLKLDFRDQSSYTVGTEFLGTSISSGGNGTDLDNRARIWMAENPHVKFGNVQRGYQRVRVRRDALTVDYRVVPHVTTEGAPISTRVSLSVEAGRGGVADIEDGKPIS